MKEKLTPEQIDDVLAETGIYYVREWNHRLGKASVHKAASIQAIPGKSITCFPTDSPKNTSTGCPWVLLGKDTNITLELYLDEHTPEYDDPHND